MGSVAGAGVGAGVGAGRLVVVASIASAGGGWEVVIDSCGGEIGLGK